MNVCYNSLGYAIMEILKQRSSCNSRITYPNLMGLIAKNYDLSPSRNTLKRTLKSLNDTANAGIQGIGSKLGIWIEENVGLMEVEALFANIVSSDYLAESCIKTFQSTLSKIRHVGPYQGLEKSTPRSERERQSNFLENLEMIHYAKANKKQLGFTYNDLDINGQLIPRCGNTHPDGVRIISIYEFYFKNSFFYVVGKDVNNTFLQNYRVDRMSDLFYNNMEAEPIDMVSGYETKDKLCLFDYLKGNYKMFNDKPVKCYFEIKDCTSPKLNYYINTIWDELGNNYLKMEKTENGVIRFTALLPPRGALLFTQQFGDFIRLIAPTELYNEMRKITKDMWKDYM